MITANYVVATLTVAFCFALVPADAVEQLIRKHPESKAKHKGSQAIEVGSSAILTATRLKHKGADFQLATAVGQNHLKIPNFVILTGRFKTFTEALQHRGGRDSSPESLGITPDLPVRYFDDPACREYLVQHFPKFVALFDAEKHGSYRGDICRTAVLAREGGFYIDMDMELRTPLRKLVDDSTTFMTVRSAYGGVLNALIASVPHNPVMFDTLAYMQKWYDNKTSFEGLLGPTTMQRALEDNLKSNCPQNQWSNVSSVIKCKHHTVRLFTEQLIAEKDCSRWGPTICPAHRAKSTFRGAKFGLFDAPSYEKIAIKSDHIIALARPEKTPSNGDIATWERRMIGWPRFANCKAHGCGLNGGVAS